MRVVGILAGAYRGKIRTTLTHLIDGYVEDTPCGIKAENLADEIQLSPPTCKKCFRVWKSLQLIN